MKKINVYEKAIKIKEGSSPKKYQVYKNAWGITKKCVITKREEEVYFQFYRDNLLMRKRFDSFKIGKLGKKKYQIVIGRNSLTIKGTKKEEIPMEYSERRFGRIEIDFKQKIIFVLDNYGREITRYSL